MELQIQPHIPRHLNVGPGKRVASVAGGLGLIAYVLARRPKLSIPLGLYAGYMLYRGATGHCVTYDVLGIKRTRWEGEAGIQVECSVTINRPRPEVYRIWRNFSNLPRFMHHLESVWLDRDDGGRRSHWVANGPAGQKIEWDAQLTEERENELLAWGSLPGSMVHSKGSVEFEDAPGDRGTIVRVSMEYNPPAGSMGAAVAKLFGEEPGIQVREDLRALKEIMETGEVPTVEGQPSGREKPEAQTAWELDEIRSA